MGATCAVGSPGSVVMVVSVAHAFEAPRHVNAATAATASRDNTYQDLRHRYAMSR